MAGKAGGDPGLRVAFEDREQDTSWRGPGFTAAGRRPGCGRGGGRAGLGRAVGPGGAQGALWWAGLWGGASASAPHHGRACLGPLVFIRNGVQPASRGHVPGRGRSWAMSSTLEGCGHLRPVRPLGPAALDGHLLREAFRCVWPPGHRHPRAVLLPRVSPVSVPSPPPSSVSG